MKTPISSTEKRSARFGVASSNDFIDVRPKKSRRLLALGIGGLILAALFAAWVWQGPYQSWQDRKVVETAMEMTRSGTKISTAEKLWRQNLQQNPESVRLYLTSQFLKSLLSENRSDVIAIQKAAHAALREAARQGSDLAALELVRLQRASEKSNFKEISRQLDAIHERVQLGVKVGDPASMYALAVMKSEGLGAAVDMAGAAELAERAANDLPPGLQESLMVQSANDSGIFKDRGDQYFAESLGDQLLRKKYYSKNSPCAGDFPDAYLDHGKCHEKWIHTAALAGNPLIFAHFAELLRRKGDAGALEWLRRAPEDTLDEAGLIILSFSEWLDGGKLPVRLYKFLSTDGDKFRNTPPEGFVDFRLSVIGNFLNLLENERKDGGVSLLKIVAVYRGLYALQGDAAPWWILDVDVDSVNNPPKWQKIFNDPRIVRAGKALSTALQSGQGLSAALKQIDMLDQPEPASISQAKPSKKYLTDEEVFGSKPTRIQQPKSAQPEIVDKDYRAKSGPLGSQSAAGGLSSFTVDNSQGDQDVVVRLYRDGKLPAVRSFVVKKGDTYTSEKIRAGNYVMRHRRIGSDTTYEADEVFRLVETPVEGGTQFSRMRVTIYKVTDGNLRTKEVPPDQF